MQRPRNNRRESNAFPTVIKSQPVQQRVFRFRAAADGTYAINAVCLLRLLFTAAIPAAVNTGYALIQSFRVRRVSLWCVDSDGTTATAFTQASLVWGSGNSSFGKNTELTDFGTNARPAHVSAAPPEGTAPGFWTNSVSISAATTFSVTVATGSIIDVELEYILNEGAAPSSWVLNNAPTTGAVYIASLDNTTSAGAWNAAPQLNPAAALTLT